MKPYYDRAGVTIHHGDGTRLVGRQAIGFDKEERYCRMAVDRLSQEVLL